MFNRGHNVNIHPEKSVGDMGAARLIGIRARSFSFFNMKIGGVTLLGKNAYMIG